MTRDRIPIELLREFRIAHNLGALLNVVLPLGAAIAVVLLGREEPFAGAGAGRGHWLRYGLVAFSVTICIVARIVLARLMGSVVAMTRRGAYRPGRTAYSYLALYSLYLCPAVWGFAHFALTGTLITFLVLVAVTALAYLFCTPGIEHFWHRR